MGNKLVIPTIKLLWPSAYERRLIWAIGLAEFKLRNEGSYLGIFWYLLNPILTFVVLVAVFSTRLGQTIEHYPIYLLIGIIVMNFFGQVTTTSAKALERHRELIKTFYFPRRTLVSGIILAALLAHIFEFIILSTLALYWGLSFFNLLFYWPIFLLMVIFTWGISLGLCALSVVAPDIENVWAFAFRLLWLGTPIFYAVHESSRLYTANLTNPLFYFISSLRQIIIFSDWPDFNFLLAMGVFSVLAFLIGNLIFTLADKKLAELV